MDLVNRTLQETDTMIYDKEALLRDCIIRLGLIRERLQASQDEQNDGT